MFLLFTGVTPTAFSCQSLFNFYPHETDCQRFYRCFWGQPHEFVCPSNTKWNQRIQTCDHAYNVPCVTAIVAKPVFEDWQTSVGIGNGFGINDGFAKPALPPVNIVKETIARPQSIKISSPHHVPTGQYPAYETGFVNTVTPTRRHPPSAGGEYVGQNEFDFPGPNSGFTGPNTGFPGPNTGFTGHNTGFPRPNTGFSRPNTGFSRPNTGFPGPNTGFPGRNTGFPALNSGNGYLHNFVNQPYRKSMWYASAGSPDPRYVRSKTTKWDLGFGSNTQYPRPNIKFVRVRDPLVGRYFGGKAWKK